MTISSNKDLADAVNNGQDTIVIEGDLKKKVLKIKATGKVAWAVAAGAISVAVITALAAPATGGASAPISAVAAPAAVTVLGASTTVTAISIAIAGGGIATLNKLRTYKVIAKNDDHVILKRK